MGLTINRTMPYPAAAARIGPGCVSRSPLRNPRPNTPHLSRWHQGLWPRAHHPIHRPPLQADQKDALHAHGPCPSTINWPASSLAALAPRCRCAEAKASTGCGFLAGLSADSAGCVLKPCGKIEAPAAPTAKGKSLKGRVLKGLGLKKEVLGGNHRDGNRQRRGGSPGASCPGRPSGRASGS